MNNDQVVFSMYILTKLIASYQLTFFKQQLLRISLDLGKTKGYAIPTRGTVKQERQFQ